MGLGAFKVVAIASFEHKSFKTDDQFQATFHQNPGFFAFVGEHFFASIGARRVNFVEKRDRPARMCAPHQFHGDGAVGDINQLVGFIDDLGRYFLEDFLGKNSTIDMGMPPSTLRKELMEGLTLFFSIIEMVLLVTPARLAVSRWERPFSLRMDCSRSPTSNAGAS